jgi:hypothetical protein
LPNKAQIEPQILTHFFHQVCLNKEVASFSFTVIIFLQKKSASCLLNSISYAEDKAVVWKIHSPVGCKQACNSQSSGQSVDLKQCYKA